MPSVLNQVRLVPASEADIINPGMFYFACLDAQKKADPESYWIVLRAPRDWLPAAFLGMRPCRDRAFAFWIVGHDQRIWLPRSALYYLDRSQREIFTERPKKLEFTNTLILIDSFRDDEAALTHFERRIVEATKKYNRLAEPVEPVTKKRISRSASSSTARVGAAVVTKTSNSDKGCPVMDSSNVDDTFDGKPVIPDDRNIRKRQCRNITPEHDLHSLPTNRAETPPQTKFNREEQRCTEPDNVNINNNIVRIIVGPENTKFVVELGKLKEKSPFLVNLIRGVEGQQFIMERAFRHIDPGDFASIVTFLKYNDYEPTMIPNPEGTIDGPQALEGCHTVGDYSRHLLLAGRLFILANYLQMGSMEKHIYHKITCATHRGYSMSAMIEFAENMLFRPGCDVAIDINKFAIKMLAENFMPIMLSNPERARYVAMMHATNINNIHTLVLERAAELAREAWLADRVVVLDE